MNELPRLRVLLVEDDELDQRVITRHLDRFESTAHDVHIEGTLEGALKILEDKEFDCILLDLSLPDSEGIASIDALLDRSPGTAVVVLTGLDDARVALEAVEHGAQDFLTKHGATTDLVGRAIQYAVAREHAETELRTTRGLVGILRDRERIGRDLHDNVIQQLFATGMSLQATAMRVQDSSSRESILGAVTSIDDAIRVLREAIFGIQSTENGPLSAAVAMIVRDEADALGLEPSVRVHAAADEIDGKVRHELLAVLREALSNVAKHAHATTCRVTVERELDEIVLRVVDNGIGISGTMQRPADQLRGRGVINMSQRAADLSGSLTLGPGSGGGSELEWRARLDV